MKYKAGKLTLTSGDLNLENAQEISPDFDILYISVFPKVDCTLYLKHSNSYGDGIFIPANGAFNSVVECNKFKITTNTTGDIYYFIKN
jgi:hypothetical protein